MIHNGIKLQWHFHRSKEMEKNAYSTLLFSIAVVKKRRGTPCSLFAGDATLFLGNPQEAFGKLLELINLVRDPRFKINFPQYKIYNDVMVVIQCNETTSC